MVQVGTMTCYDSTNFDTTPGLEAFGSTHLSQCGGGKRRSKRRRSKRRSSKRRSSKRRSSKRRRSKRRSSKRRRSKRRSVKKQCKCPSNCKKCKKHNCRGGNDCPCDTMKHTRRSSRRKRRRSFRKSKSRRIRRTRRHFKTSKKKGGASIEEGVPPTERRELGADFWGNVNEGMRELKIQKCKDQYDECLKKCVL